jgi:hypothetical protein
MISFDLGARIVRPLKQVFHFVTSPENDFQWQYGTLAATRLSPGEFGIGSIFRVVGHFLGERRESTCEVTEFELYKRYGYRSQSGTILSNTAYSFDMKGGRTELRLAVQINPGDLFKPSIAMTEKQLKKQYKENLALLKEILEATPRERAAQLPAWEERPQEPG